MMREKNSMSMYKFQFLYNLSKYCEFPDEDYGYYNNYDSDNDSDDDDKIIKNLLINKYGEEDYKKIKEFIKNNIQYFNKIDNIDDEY